MSKQKQKTTQVLVDNTNQNLQQVLIKKAMGFKIKETVQEFVAVEDEMKLTKKKVSVKYYPPDLNAIELLLKTRETMFDFENYTDEELEAEKQKLIKQLKLFNSAEKEVSKTKSKTTSKEETKNSKTIEAENSKVKEVEKPKISKTKSQAKTNDNKN